MKVLPVALALVWIASAASAQPAVPEGVGALLYKEKVKVKGGCDSFAELSVLTLTIESDGTWNVLAPAGEFSGTMEAADADGRVWNLAFDPASLALYEQYLETVATSLCGTSVTLLDLAFDRFQAKFKKDRGAVSIQLGTSALGATAFGDGEGRHALKAKGVFVPMP